MEEQKRHSGFETMRILSMVMIVLMHGIGHGGLGSAAPQGSAAFWIYWLLFILARVSTNCFVMLSASVACFILSKSMARLSIREAKWGEAG